MGDRFRDFDAVFERQEPLVVRLYDQDWELPAELPAIVTLKVARWAANGRESIGRAEQLDLAADLIPGPVLDQWMSLGMSTDQLAQILTWVMRCYMGSAHPGSPPEAGAPTEGAPSTSSSSTGD